jgi:hypothetical protein
MMREEDMGTAVVMDGNHFAFVQQNECGFKCPANWYGAVEQI